MSVQVDDGAHRRVGALFTPGAIGPVVIRNRTVMPPITTRYADDEGFVTDDLIAYYSARGRGGAGLIVVEMASPEPVGRHRRRELSIYDDRFVPGLTRLASEIKAAGARVSIQLGHGGGHTREDICGEHPIAPSAIPHWVMETTGQTIVPREMSKARIDETIEAFVEAARRAQTCGFDMVELHAAHGYLISQFLCPAENLRADEYGGSLENRARFGLEVIRRIRSRVPGLPIVFRANVDDHFPGGLAPVEGVEVCRLAAAAGADAIHVTAGHYRSRPSAAVMIPPMAYAEGVFLDHAAKVRRVVDVPVIAVGRLGNPDVATGALDSAAADFVALGRPLLADPEWVSKVEAGRAVRRCLACNTCVDEMRGGARLGCLVNPSAGRERFHDPEGMPVGERIAVVGAGPAGLSYAALVAGRNRVTVFEQSDRAGGAFRYAGRAPLFQDVEADAASLDVFVDELERACRERGVEFHYDVDVTGRPGLLDPFSRIVIATGAAYRYGLGPVARWLLNSGWARRRPLSRLFRNPRLRNWFYYRARRPSETARLIKNGAGGSVSIIGDAARPGKGGEAIAAAFSLAFGTADDPGAPPAPPGHPSTKRRIMSASSR